MKANELMIGDLVYYIHTEDGIAPYKEVIRIKAEDLCRDACIIETHYEPILLTTEILEKNGWRCFNVYHTYDHPKVPFYLRQQKDGGYALEVDNDYGGAVFSFILYVHQLQHALRLCGIEKEIEL